MANRILLIEDNPPGLMALSEALRIKLPDNLVDTAPSGEVAVALLLAHQYDCVICDVLLPGVDGIGLLQFIRQQQPDLSVVMVTAGEFLREEDARRHGAVAFLPKPLDVDLLIGMVRQAIERTQVLRVSRQNKSRAPDSS